MFFSLAAVLVLAASVHAWIPGYHEQIISKRGVDLFNRSSLYEHGHVQKRFLPSNYGNDHNAIRGVNLGSLSVVENWMANTVFSGFDCNPASEFDCVSSINNQAIANSDFQAHWDTWVTQDDFTEMQSYGLNTVRIPVGYWVYDALVDSSEHFAQGGATYLDQIVGYAKTAGMYVIIDLHGSPGAQVTDPFTGQDNPNPGFYEDYNYNRSYVFLNWLTNRIHTSAAYSTVGMLMVVNEPERTWDTTTYPNAIANAQSMRQTYYPTAWNTIRNAESALGVPSSNKLHIQMMDEDWESGGPNQYLTDLNFAAYDDHEYVKYSGIAEPQSTYLAYSCADSRSGKWPIIVGEWSLSVPDDMQLTAAWEPIGSNVAWYKQWWAAQVMAYERGDAVGWCFWTWKTTGLNDPRWDYRMAVSAGLIDKDIDVAYSMDACSGVSSKRSDVEAYAAPLWRFLMIPVIAMAWVIHGQEHSIRCRQVQQVHRSMFRIWARN